MLQSHDEDYSNTMVNKVGAAIFLIKIDHLGNEPNDAAAEGPSPQADDKKRPNDGYTSGDQSLVILFQVPS